MPGLRTKPRIIFLGGLVLFFSLLSSPGFLPNSFSQDQPLPNYPTVAGYLITDINRDGKVDSQDLAILQANYLNSPPDFLRADINGDNLVNNIDLELLRRDYNKKATLICDLNRDYTVNIYDLVKVSAKLGASVSDFPDSDINRDTRIDNYDLEIMRQAFGKNLNEITGYLLDTDLNRDGQVNLEDRRIVQEARLPWADVNKDTQINNLDLNLIERDIPPEGQLIGPEGGEVISPDAKAKVIIPPGALSEPTRISILTVNLQELQRSLPAGISLAEVTPPRSSILSLVECLPYGLIFSRPVNLILTLSQAEIPGTPVELGFYDRIQQRIISTGQTSAVPADGYTLRFSIMHFSTYAALKSLGSPGPPIGGGVKIPLPDMFTGAFSHAIPITLPPGRKGIQPGLALVYRSSNPNSWTGLGFSLNPGYIVRSTKLGPPKYNDTQDDFYLVTDSGTTELTHLVDNLYQAKIESSFTKFFKETDDSWRVVGKDGSSLRFGQTSDSKETSSSGTFSWHLTKAQDTNGNYIQYHYTKDQGKSYLSRIDYTGNESGISPTNSVEFFLESRNDIPSSYISTSKIATAKRLREMQVKVNSDLVWRYVLEYNYSQDTNRSLLHSITQYGADSRSLPTQSFSYQRAR